MTITYALYIFEDLGIANQIYWDKDGNPQVSDYWQQEKHNVRLYTFMGIFSFSIILF